MQFLYPTSRQFPFDQACDDIVRMLEKRDWDVPGITVAHRDYGGSYRYVSTIRGTDFALSFCRIQGRLSGEWNDVAGVTQITIPRKQLQVHHDESGPTFHLYVGEDYARDRQSFMNDSKVNSRLRHLPKTYLTYSGQCSCRSSGGLYPHLPHRHPGRRPPSLAHTNDLGREYSPEGDEPTSFATSDVMEEFSCYLQDAVLKTILACPVK